MSILLYNLFNNANEPLILIKVDIFTNIILYIPLGRPLSALLYIAIDSACDFVHVQINWQAYYYIIVHVNELA